MIDLESDIFDYIATAVRNEFSGAYVVGEYIDVPAKFPAVTIVEASNGVLQTMRTLHIENAANVMYEVNIYSNKTSGKKAQAKQIANTIDEKFSEIGFTRTFRDQIPNMNDATIYRIVCRYQAVIDDDFWIYHNYI